MNRNSIISTVIVVGLSMGLVSCGGYRKFELPEPSAEVDSLYRFVESTADTTTIAALSWRDLFSDSDLQSLIEEGLANNSDLNIARSKVAESEALLRKAGLAYLPSLNLSPQATSSYGAGHTSHTYTLGASAQWEIDIFGKLTAAKRQSKAMFEQSTAYRQAVETQIIATVAANYYTLLMLDAQLAVTKQTLANWEETLRVMNALKRAGSTNEAAIAQTETNKIAIERSVVELSVQIETLENSLSSLIGRVSGEIKRSGLESQSFPRDFSVGLPIELLSNRPDVKSAEYALASAFYGTQSARAAFYPSITLGGTAGWSNSVGGIIVNPMQFLASATASLVQPIFNRGALTANLEVAKERQKQAEISFNQAVLDAGVEVNNSLTEWQGAIEQIEIAKRGVEASSRAVKSTELLMEYSSTNYLDVITAKNAKLSAELALIAVSTTEIQSVISLYRALGGGAR